MKFPRREEARIFRFPHIPWHLLYEETVRRAMGKKENLKKLMNHKTFSDDVPTHPSAIQL